jgi:hypothetical protein
MDLWIAGLLGLNSKKSINAVFKEKFQNRHFGFFPCNVFCITL